MKRTLLTILAFSLCSLILFIGGCGQGGGKTPLTGTITPTARQAILWFETVNSNAPFTPTFLVDRAFGINPSPFFRNADGVKTNNVQVYDSIVTTPEYTSGWWTSYDTTADAFMVSTLDFKVKVYNISNTELTTLAQIPSMDKFLMKVNITSTSTMGGSSFIYGTDNRPFTFSGITTGTLEMDGYAGIVLDHVTSSAAISLDYQNVPLNNIPMPSSGQAACSITGTYYVPVNGTVTFTDTIDTFVFTAPPSMTGKIYRFDNNTGDLTWEAQ